jgi:hypothetical protein
MPPSVNTEIECPLSLQNLARPGHQMADNRRFNVDNRFRLDMLAKCQPRG